MSPTWTSSRPSKAAGLEFCYPEVSDGDKDTVAEAAFDLALARKLVPEGGTVVGNDLRLAGPERIFVVTGPNHGGKTTFARMFGQLHYLASLGYPVPARRARLFLPDRIFTHFEREEDLATLSGKLEDELVRIHGVLEEATGRSLVVMNESFASTTLRDAALIGRAGPGPDDRPGTARRVRHVRRRAGISQRGLRVSMVGTVDPDNPAERTFKIVRKPADGLAYAVAIARKVRADLRAAEGADRLMKAFLMYRTATSIPIASLPAQEPEPRPRTWSWTRCSAAMAGGDKFLYDMREAPCSPALATRRTITYRQHILADCLAHPASSATSTTSPSRRSSARTAGLRLLLPRFARTRSCTGPSQLIELFVRASAAACAGIADEHAAGFRSEGFTRFFAMLASELERRLLRRASRRTSRAASSSAAR